MYRIEEVKKAETMDSLEKFDKTQLVQNEFYLNLLYFLNVLENNFDSRDLDNLYNNIISIKIRFPGIFSLEDRKKLYASDGMYFPSKNEILIKQKNFVSTVNHELLHLASTTEKNKRYFCGFWQQERNINIGYGLNEGYTSLLERRYFNKDIKKSVYELIMEYLEKIVGEYTLGKFYLRAEDKIVDFINGLDYFYENTSLVFEKRFYINDVYNFLVLTYSNKQLGLYSAGVLSRFDCYISVTNFALEIADSFRKRFRGFDFGPLAEEITENFGRRLKK